MASKEPGPFLALLCEVRRGALEWAVGNDYKKWCRNPLSNFHGRWSLTGRTAGYSSLVALRSLPRCGLGALTIFMLSWRSFGWRGRTNINGGLKVPFCFRWPAEVSLHFCEGVEGGNDLRCWSPNFPFLRLSARRSRLLQGCLVGGPKASRAQKKLEGNSSQIR